MRTLGKIIVFILAAGLLLGLTACGDTPDGPDGGASGRMRAEDLAGGVSWVGDNGCGLALDPDGGSYTLRTWYGRIGSGVLRGVDDESGEWLQLDFNGLTYDLLRDGDGFRLSLSDGAGASDASDSSDASEASDPETLDGVRFTASDNELPDIPLSLLDGVWQNALGETLLIDTERMQYISCSADGLGNGTLHDKNDGRGPYLFLGGYAYPRISADGKSFSLFFVPSDTQTPDGSFSGVFYLDGNAAEYADVSKSSFVEQDGHLWYYDGVRYYGVPAGYTVGDDGRAYDEGGRVYAAGWESPVYDPAADWGEGWSENWS